MSATSFAVPAALVAVAGSLVAVSAAAQAQCREAASRNAAPSAHGRGAVDQDRSGAPSPDARRDGHER